MALQYIRQCRLLLGNKQNEGIDVSEFHITFQVQHSTVQTPNRLEARIYNLGPETTLRAENQEFTKVVLQAGYEGNFGTIFNGEIKQIRIGRENATDSFIDIFAADKDILYNYAVANFTLARGYTQKDLWQRYGREAAKFDTTQGDLPPDLPLEPAPRGRACVGMLRNQLDTFDYRNQTYCNVYNGQLRADALMAYEPGDIIKLDATSGVVGVPQQTELGISVTTLLNPAIGHRSRIQLDNKSIARNVYNPTRVVTGLDEVEFPFPALDPDGQYVVVVVDHVGDTRGNPWYTQVLALSVDPTAGGSALTARPPQLTNLNVPLPDGTSPLPAPQRTVTFTP